MRYKALQSFTSPDTGNITVGDVVHIHEKIGKQFESAKLVESIPEDFTEPAGEARPFVSSLAGQASRVLTLTELGDPESEPLPSTEAASLPALRRSSTRATLNGGTGTGTRRTGRSAGRSTKPQLPDSD